MAENPCGDLIFGVPDWIGFRCCVVHVRVWGALHHIGVGSCQGVQFVAAVGKYILGRTPESSTGDCREARLSVGFNPICECPDPDISFSYVSHEFFYLSSDRSLVAETLGAFSRIRHDV